MSANIKTIEPETTAADYMAKANTLMEALPWIKESFGKTIVIKYGGAAMTDPVLRNQVADDIVLMKLMGVQPVIVHGGGRDVTDLSEALGLKAEFVGGLRVTTPQVMEVVKMALVGKVNKEIVNAINVHGRYAVGISGEDGGLVTGVPISDELGRAGRVTQIDTSVVDNLLMDEFIPVIATVAIGEDGQSLNINADVVASELAVALGADKCIFLTDVDGIYADFTDKTSLISVLSTAEASALMGEGVDGDHEPSIAGGMIPKIRSCVDVVRGGVRRAHILNGTIPHSLLLEVYTDAGVGTMVTDEEGATNHG